MKVVYCALLGACLAVATGCSQPTVTGKVTLDGQPIPEGNIAFVPESGSGAGANSNIVNGEYKVQTVAGKYKVEINASKLMPLPPGVRGMDGATEEVRPYIPGKYNNKTELRATVPATEKVDFELKST